MNLYLKYRPNDFDELLGNKENVSILRNLVENNKVPKAFLFYGDSGCGKTTVARIIANSLDSEVIEINSSDFRGIDTIREINESSKYPPFIKSKKVYIIDEVHKLTNDAQNAFLKTLEDSPSFNHFILCTTEPQKLIEAIRSRCVSFVFKPLDFNDSITLLRRVCFEEGITLSREQLEEIAQKAEGKPREMLQLLEKIANLTEEERNSILQEEKIKETQIIELCRILMKGERNWNKVSEILKQLKNEDSEEIRRTILNYLKEVMLNEKNEDVLRKCVLLIELFKESTFYTGFSVIVYNCYLAINS